MKTTDLIWKVANTTLLVVILAAILLFGIMILKKVNRCCDCNESKLFQEKVLILRTAELYDSLTHVKGTRVWIDTLSFGEQGNSSLTIWYPCPEKEIKAPVVVKEPSYVKKVTKTETTKITAEKAMPFVAKEEPVKKDTCLQVNIFVKEKPTLYKPITSGMLKIDLESVTLNKVTSLYSQVNVLPLCSFGTRTRTEFNYDVVPDIHLQEHIKKAKTHLWIGTGLASAGAIGYASTWFTEIPTFVDYNGLSPFDPANKYYDQNVRERERLNTLKWIRGVGVVVGVLGGVEVIHGILLLKNADLNIAPQRITLRYSF